MSEPSQVRNAADRGQVRRAKDNDEQQELDRLNAIRVVLGTYQGRRAVYEWCITLGLFRSVYAGSAQIYHQAGMQDAARKLWQDCEEADLELVVAMHDEAIERQKAARDERLAARRSQRAG